MLQTEWGLSSNWIPHHVSYAQWLLVHCTDAKCNNKWSDYEESDDDKDSDDDEVDSDGAGSDPDDKLCNECGAIPHFSRVYEVKVEKDIQVFSCTCCHQQQMDMPCHHIASVCRDNDTILGSSPQGFPIVEQNLFV
jgi:hypothetical protein